MMLIRKAVKGKRYIWDNQNPLLPWLNVLFNKWDTDLISGWRWKRWRSWWQCEKGGANGPTLGWVDGRGYLAWFSEQARHCHTTSPWTPKRPSKADTSTLTFQTRKQVSVWRADWRWPFPTYPLREFRSTLPQPSAQKQWMAFKERSGKLQQLGSLN